MPSGVFVLQNGISVSGVLMVVPMTKTVTQTVVTMKSVGGQRGHSDGKVVPCAR